MNCCIDWQRFFNCLLEIFCCLHSRFFSICYSCLAEVFCLLGQHYSRIMKGPARFVFVLLVEIYLCSLCDCILLGKEEDQYLKQVVKEFESDPENGKYDRIIESPYICTMYANSKAFYLVSFTTQWPNC